MNIPTLWVLTSRSRKFKLHQCQAPFNSNIIYHSNSRPLVPPAELDADDMSIGDESDDADLTEFDTDSEDDIASIGELVTTCFSGSKLDGCYVADDEHNPWASLRPFAHWTTRYSTSCLRRPSYWRGSPYIKDRVRNHLTHLTHDLKAIIELPLPQIKASCGEHRTYRSSPIGTPHWK